MNEVVQLFPKVDPWWVTGLTDGEGCFYSSLRFRSGVQAFKSKGGKRYDSFEFNDPDLLHKLVLYFGVGYVPNYDQALKKTGKSGSHPNPCKEYRCSVLDDLRNVIVPHFEKYTLQSKKRKDFEIWKQTLDFYVSIAAQANHGWWKREPEKLAQLTTLVGSLREGRAFDVCATGGLING